jgi:hypothetical protein
MANDLQRLRTDPVLKKRLAKLMALRCFRNTLLEDFHAGKVPVSKTGDYSDVKVVTPDRAIPWAELSRLNDHEMQLLMIDVNQCHRFLGELLDDSKGSVLLRKLQASDPLPSGTTLSRAVRGYRPKEEIRPLSQWGAPPVHRKMDLTSSSK